MLKAHQELLAQVQLAEELALAIHARGARGIEDSVRRLRQVGNDVKDRVRQYEAATKTEVRKQKTEIVKPELTHTKDGPSRPGKDAKN
jgi:hypothetical protein